MRYYLAPMEGITNVLYRNAVWDLFPPMDQYFTPFLTPTRERSMSPRQRRDLIPEENRAQPLIPQLLTNRAEDFVATTRILRDMGYPEVNLNLGCPSGTVVSKGKGAGFLAHPEKLNAFLEEIFTQLGGGISVKTRLGILDPDEFPPLLEIFQRYPFTELILHPRVQKDFYRHPARRDAFAALLPHIHLPLCYNGDLFTPQDVAAFTQAHPSVDAIMLGRGILANPGLLAQMTQGVPLSLAQFQAFHDRLYADYQAALSGPTPVLHKMKELWTYWLSLFALPNPYAKAIRKAQTLREYRDASQRLFQEQTFLPQGSYPA